MHLKTKYKLSLMIIFFLVLLCIFVINLFISRDYKIEYISLKYNVTESFIKKDNVYKIKINNLEYYIKDKYSSKRHLVNNIKYNKDCYSFTFKNKTYSLCNDDNIYYVNYINNTVNNKIIDEFKNIKIYDYLDYKYYIWNYNYFIVLNKDYRSTISLFNNDIYELKYISIINNDLIIADYDSDYTFNKFYLLNTSDDNYKTIEIFQNLSFDGYILGSYKNYVYLYDNKKSHEYKLNPYTNDIVKISYRILKNGKFEDISLNKLSKMKYYFSVDEEYYYFINNNNLYYHNYDQDILVSNTSVNRIITSDDNSCFFISGDTIYYNSINNGTKKIMSYTEWKFNNNNIYIFNNEK